MPGKIGEAFRGFLRSFIKFDVPISAEAEENISKISEAIADMKTLNEEYRKMAESANHMAEESLRINKELVEFLNADKAEIKNGDMPNYIA